MREIGFTACAAGELEKVYKADEKLFFRFITAIETLKINPYQDKHLKGRLAGDYSLYIGNHRVIYTIHKRKLVVYVVDLGEQWKDINNIKIKNA